jgi:hypothetical protein
MPLGIKASRVGAADGFNLNELLRARGDRVLVDADRMAVERKAREMPPD